MDNIEFNWSEILEISMRFWGEDLELLNDKQIEIIQKSIEDNKNIEELLSDFGVGFKMDYALIWENAKLIFEIVVTIYNVVILYKNIKKDESDILLEIRKSSKTKQAILKMKELSDEELKEMIKMIKASRSFNQAQK